MDNIQDARGGPSSEDPVSQVPPGPQTDAATPQASSASAKSPDAETFDFDEESALRNLTENVRDQDDLERDISFQANLALIDAEDKKDQKRIAKSETTKAKLETQKRAQQQKLRAAYNNPTLKLRIEKEIARINAEIELIEKDISDFNARIEQRHQDGADEASAGSAGNRRLPNETQREFLIRTGKITPFAKFGGPRPDGIQGDLANAIIEAEDEAVAEELEKEATEGPRSHQNLRLPGFAEEPDSAASPATSAAESEFSLRPRKKRRVQVDATSDEEYKPEQEAAFTPDSIGFEDEDSDDVDLTDLNRNTSRKRSAKKAAVNEDKLDLSGIDDGNENVYQHRLADWVDRRSRARRRRQEALGQPVDDQTEEEWFKPSPDEPDHYLEHGLKLPGDIYPSLFDYQKTGVQWLAELYDQKVGGIVGDEMGLGKTVQLISFVAALHYSKMLNKPVIVVAPATVLRQWVNEFHRWWPPLRVSILHSSGSGMLNVRNEDRLEEDEYDWDRETKPAGSSKAAKKIVDRVVKHGHVLVTTYAGLQTYGDVLIPVDWGYAVLDEGHKIRNPNTAITVYCKELRTANRIILSGTPMQNNLTELWSLFDFIYPMRLGTLVNFRNQFELPIKQGGYANATNLQIMTAQKCAETLKDAISPYLLQRLKVDVAADLPKKSEQVLFCKLTQPQREAYESFLKSEAMDAILKRTRQSLYGIDILRKVCNHPDLLDPQLRGKVGYNWGSPVKSGKMQVVKALLQMWKHFGHKTLLFSQGTQMLDILESFVRRQGDINYLRMDGKTAIKDRQTLVDKFNNDPDLHLFLLTTKVGGLGVNLTGANRVIIFDPDWNPSTDVQARERAWRLGQKKEVTIYRLMTAGTIEEKIYHRQIFKQFLTNKVLKDPKQRASFGLHDLHDLFTLGSYEDGATETSELFKSSEVQIQAKKSLITPGRDSVPIVIDGHKKDGKATNGADKTEGDLRGIAGVAGLEDYQEDPETAPPPSDEARIMEGILGGAAMHSVVEHDQIVGSGKPRADPAILRQEANRVASEAAAHLQRSENQARHVPIGTVTWTGEVGSAGRPAQRRRGPGGPSSASIRAGLASRQGLSGSSSSRSGTPDGGGGGINRNMGPREFEKAIQEFIRRHSGQVPSKLLVDHFNRFCPGPRQAGDFKTALDKVAMMEKKGSSMRAIWALKPAYK
ncbi:uncharacterized protein E0L32_006530 [Thyridium curvatum]|uniref:Uncharacterized protein n=1 Tax=Thyridium curvatum TaxID=1093900 RepID=A0A507B301_9PEZI|nr:uncharacterized protein E0L32_006530 [Thyridium curvatum]TPX13104.1 hypothetical protein E0L32_006530 [Thyridium curvatum]